MRGLKRLLVLIAIACSMTVVGLGQSEVCRNLREDERGDRWRLLVHLNLAEIYADLGDTPSSQDHAIRYLRAYAQVN